MPGMLIFLSQQANKNFTTFYYTANLLHSRAFLHNIALQPGDFVVPDWSVLYLPQILYNKVMAIFRCLSQHQLSPKNYWINYAMTSAPCRNGWGIKT